MKNFKLMMIAFLIAIFFAGAAFAGDMKGHDMTGSDMKGHNMTGSDMKGHNMTGSDMAKSDRVGDLIHESMVDGYMLSYYFMDLRHQDIAGHDTATMDESKMDESHDMMTKEMDKPHHLMVYIMDKNHQPVLKGKVGFLIKDAQGNARKAMGMFMSNGFGTTADMKKKGVYTITTKAVLGDKKLMDRFEYEMK